MNPEHFARLKKVILKALRLPEEERARYLDTIGGEDDSLRREVEELIAREQDAPAALRTGGLGRLVETLMGGDQSSTAEAPIPDTVGDTT